MSKKITIRKGTIKKRVSKDTWDAMVKGKATYGWVQSSDLPSEVSEVEEKLKTGNVVNILKAGLRDIKDEIPSLNISDLNLLLYTENGSEKPRVGVIEAIEKQISKLS